MSGTDVGAVGLPLGASAIPCRRNVGKPGPAPPTSGARCRVTPNSRATKIRLSVAMMRGGNHRRVCPCSSSVNMGAVQRAAMRPGRVGAVGPHPRELLHQPRGGIEGKLVVCSGPRRLPARTKSDARRARAVGATPRARNSRGRGVVDDKLGTSIPSVRLLHPHRAGGPTFRADSSRCYRPIPGTYKHIKS